MANSTEAEDFLEHHGVLGMHWGRHLAGRTEPSHNSKPAHSDYTSTKELRKNPTRSLSNAELQTVNNRMQLETTYSQLKSKQGHLAKIKKGNEAAKLALGVGGTLGTIYGLAKTDMGKKIVAKGVSIVKSKV